MVKIDRQNFYGTFVASPLWHAPKTFSGNKKATFYISITSRTSYVSSSHLRRSKPPRQGKRTMSPSISERQYQPLPTLGIRLASVINCNTRHAGQIEYLRGLVKHQGLVSSGGKIEHQATVCRGANKSIRMPGTKPRPTQARRLLAFYHRGTSLIK